MKKNLVLLLQIAIALLTRLFFRALYIYPIKKNRVLFQAFREKQYACNPKYISEKLKKQYGNEIEIGWTFRNPEKFSFLSDQGIRVMKAGTFEAYKFALTAKVVCVNTYYKPTLPRRKGQYFIRTWHGGGAYKRVGKMQKMPRLERYYLSLQQEGADLYLSSSLAFTQMTLQDSFGYFGDTLDKGMPRNDILIRGADESEILRIRRDVGLADGQRLALYAPTYRSDIKPHAFGIDYNRISRALEKRFGGSWVFGYRGHHITHRESHRESASGAINLTDYPDMQELLLAAGVLITDYSSSIWDMSLTKKPALLYATDLKDYSAERDFYTDIRSWPFPLSENNDELEKNILEFDDNKYLKDVQSHHKALGSYETGRAAEYAAKRIYEICTGGSTT
ncbi:MAG: CDP-glycerol glycerophosphotransferase family protein [Clostridia bacterium]|nr:CDP-glycerol glycerophosphotransferase family protein [Clostridia bacterium]